MVLRITAFPHCQLEENFNVHENSHISDRHRGGQLPTATRRCMIFGLIALLATTSVACSRIKREPANEQTAALSPIAQLIAKAKETTAGQPPSHDRLWRPDLAVLPYGEIESDRVKLYNIRDCEYRSEEDYDVRHQDLEIWLDQLKTVDFIVVPFKEAPSIAHTMISFGLSNGEHIVFSVEARLEQNEQYSVLASTNNQYELMWVVGTERDLIRLRTEVRDVDVYLYPIKATPGQVRDVFLSSIARINEIVRQPEFYDLITNNCTTNIVDMVNNLRPGAIPSDIRVVLPGHSDRLAYDLGLLAVEGDFEQIKRGARINSAARIHADSANFSRAIRMQR